MIAAIVILVSACLAGALLWSLAVYALPLWCGALVAISLHASGVGWLASLAAGLAAAVATLAIGQILLGAARSPLVRAGVGLAFALPAAIAGYHAAHGIAAAFGSDSVTRVVMSVIAAAITGGAAWSGALRSRGEPRPPMPRQA